MRATLMYKSGDVRVEEVPDPTIQEPTDALLRVTYACVCGSDLHPYHDLEETPEGRRMGHEAIGVVEEVGDQVTTLKPGETVIVPFAWSDGTCAFCRDGITTSCVHGALPRRRRGERVSTRPKGGSRCSRRSVVGRGGRGLRARRDQPSHQRGVTGIRGIAEVVKAFAAQRADPALHDGLRGARTGVRMTWMSTPL